MSKETRVVATQPVHELRMVDDEASGATMLVGYGAVFGKRSQDLGGFTEIIEPAAFNRSLSEGGDVLCCVNHDVNLLLGRSASDTLRLSVDDVGLRYEIDMPDTSAGRDAMVLAERGDLFGSSFTFSVAPSGERWDEDDDGRRTRFLSEVRLYELGPVVSPAYLDTTTGVRSMDKFVEETASAVAECVDDEADEVTSRKDADPVAGRINRRR